MLIVKFHLLFSILKLVGHALSIRNIKHLETTAEDLMRWLNLELIQNVSLHFVKVSLWAEKWVQLVVEIRVMVAQLNFHLLFILEELDVFFLDTPHYTLNQLLIRLSLSLHSIIFRNLIKYFLVCVLDFCIKHGNIFIDTVKELEHCWFLTFFIFSLFFYVSLHSFVHLRRFRQHIPPILIDF